MWRDGLGKVRRLDNGCKRLGKVAPVGRGGFLGFLVGVDHIPGAIGRPVPLHKTTGSQPLIFVTREGAKVRYFTVEINVDTDTVTVSAPGLND